MNKLKFHLQKFEKNLTFQILDQKVPYGIRKSYNLDDFNISISSVAAPAISIGPLVYFFNGGSKTRISKDMVSDVNRIEIYLQGKDVQNNDDVILIPFRDNDSRDIIYDLIIKSLKKFCKEPQKGEIIG